MNPERHEAVRWPAVQWPMGPRGAECPRRWRFHGRDRIRTSARWCALGYIGSLNLLHKCLNQGRHEGDRIVPSARRLTSWITTRPENLPDKRRAHLDELFAACPEMTAPARVLRDFAQLMGERRGDDLDSWIADVRAAQLPEPAPSLTGLDQDRGAVLAGIVSGWCAC
jgi:hypothetical protein